MVLSFSCHLFLNLNNMKNLKRCLMFVMLFPRELACCNSRQILFRNYKIFLLTFFVILTNWAGAQTKPLRRPISPDQPMWLIHIDTWNYADPQKIIDLIPKDIRPFVVMNISLSISHDAETSQFHVAEYGYEIAKSWIRICAENQMWAMIQHSSGGFAHFSDHDLTVYEEFYQDYPNLLGFSYAEQFWGFNDPNDPLSPDWTDRISHFANLLKLSNQYGGYLVVSWCGNQWSPSINPIAMLKRNPDFEEASRLYTENFILFEKYTQQAYQSDMESICLGAYLSGYSGQYGIRYDDTGWTDANGNHENFTMATAGAPHLEHMMLTGQAVVDGPELIWTQCFRETNRVSTSSGYMTRNWETFPQFDNVSVDLFRKVLDGTVRIPTRDEVIQRTKVVVVNDVSSGSTDEIYSSPETLFEGLYRMDGDGNLKDNKSFFKKTGRYPTIPTVFQLADQEAQTFQLQVNQSDYASKWPTVSAKVNELNDLFPEEYTGDLYAGRHENGWVVYNPYKTNQTASAVIPFIYNTCASMELTFSQYTAGVVKEKADQLSFYLNNYDNVLNTGLKTDVITINGSTSEPSYSFEDRGDHSASVVSKNWSNGVFTLTVQHNGPLDITVNCSGTATDRLTDYTDAAIEAPIQPSIYTGPVQYEAEHFDYKNISGITTAGHFEGIRNYTGQGYLNFGNSSTASVRDNIRAFRKGNYVLEIRYTAPSAAVNDVDVFVNGNKVATPNFARTANLNTWGSVKQTIYLNEGDNEIRLSASSSSARVLYLDNIIISQNELSNVYHFTEDQASSQATTPAAELVSVLSGSAGVVSYTNASNQTSNSIKTYSVGSAIGTGVADLELFNTLATDYYVTWKEYHTAAGGRKGFLMRGTGEYGSCPYADGLKQGYLFISEYNTDGTISLEIYKADENGITSKTNYVSDFTVGNGSPSWYRAFVYQDKILFECSNDSINWVGSSATEFTDGSYLSGSTQLVWGLGSDNHDWVVDNIAYATGNISISTFILDGFRYVQGSGPSDIQKFTTSGTNLTGDIVISATTNYEVSLNDQSGFDSSINLPLQNGNVDIIDVFVRMKSGLPVDNIPGGITLSSGGIFSQEILLDGNISPQPITLEYTFEDDTPTNGASTPPAQDVTVGSGNSASAGVVSYTDNNDLTSNALTPYGVGQRNSTGVLDLNRFSTAGTDYSVTWKQYIASANSQYKIGVLLRGDQAKVGGTTTGYVQGIMEGYLCLVYHTGTSSEFRIYRSTSSGLDILTNAGVGSLAPSPGQPVWYRASVSGSIQTSLTFEYSLDGETWITAASTSESNSPYQAGSTQVVWGLAVSSVDFYLDDITFEGVDENSGSLPDVIVTSVRELNGFNYLSDNGPSEVQSFTISASALVDDISINCPSGYEISLSENDGYISEITLGQTNGDVVETTLFIRLKSGLENGQYDGDVVISSTGVLNKKVSLSGTVGTGAEIVVTTNSISGFNYHVGDGPSISQWFKVSGSFLTEDITVQAPENYEVSFGSSSGFTSNISIPVNNGEASSVAIWVRMKSGLASGQYNESLALSSPGASGQNVAVSGEVSGVLGFGDPTASRKSLVVWYFSMDGRRLTNTENYSGVIIKKELFSDGAIQTSKHLILNFK